MSEEFKELFDDGVRHARGISDTLNARALAAAAKAAADTGTAQAPTTQVMIGQSFNRCARCSPGRKPVTVVSVPAPAFAVPPPT